MLSGDLEVRRQNKIDERLDEVDPHLSKWRVHQVKLGRKSEISAAGRKSVWSGCSSKERFPENPVNAPRNKQRSSHDDRESQGWRYEGSADSLRRWFLQIKQELKNQRDVCLVLIESNEERISQNEVHKLDETYKHLVDTAFRLREQLPSLEADEIKVQVDIEDEEVFAVKKQMINRRASGSHTDKEYSPSKLISKHMSGIIVGEDGKLAGKKSRLNHEMSTIRVRLENQKSLIADLLMTEDMEMMNREVEKLDQVYNDYVAIAAEVREFASVEEVEEMSKVIAEEDNEVFHFKKLVAKFKAKSRKDSTPTAKSKDEVDGGEVAGEKSIKQDKAGPEITQLNELMIQTLKLQAAPKVEIETFRGDPLEYSYFMDCFKDVVENLVENPRQRLVRLLKYTEGDAKDLIKHCIQEDTSTCYDEAVRLLEKEYGNPFTTSCAYLEKLKSWPQIKNNDGVGLKGLYRFW